MTTRSKHSGLAQQLIGVLYDLFEPGQESQFSSSTLMEVAGIEEPIVNVRQTLLRIEKAGGIFTRRRAGISGLSGRRSFITLHAENKDVALSLWDNRNKGKRGRKSKVNVSKPHELVRQINPPVETVAVTDREDETTKAIAGPDSMKQFESLRALRKSEAAALVEAARQYRDREVTVRKAMADLRAKGINIRYETDYESDDRLEHVDLTLPYIEGLERTAENALRRYDEDQKEIRRLREQIEGLRRELRRHQVAPTVVGAER